MIRPISAVDCQSLRKDQNISFGKSREAGGKTGKSTLRAITSDLSLTLAMLAVLGASGCAITKKSEPKPVYNPLPADTRVEPYTMPPLPRYTTIPPKKLLIDPPATKLQPFQRLEAAESTEEIPPIVSPYSGFNRENIGKNTATATTRVLPSSEPLPVLISESDLTPLIQDEVSDDIPAAASTSIPAPLPIISEDQLLPATEIEPESNDVDELEIDSIPEFEPVKVQSGTTILQAYQP